MPHIINLNHIGGTEITWELAGLGGPPGRNATINIGTTTTGEPDTDAEVVNSGTEIEAVLDFTIPRGEKGEPGAIGSFYRHDNSGAPATAWVVTHNLGYHPNVQVEDTAGQVWIPSGVEHIDDTLLRVDFDIPFSGYANCS